MINANGAEDYMGIIAEEQSRRQEMDRIMKHLAAIF